MNGATPRIFGILLVVLCIATPAVLAQQLAISNFMPDDGLAHPQVWAVHQDGRGYLWIGTTDGVNRYDGTSFSRITVRDGLRNITVRTIIEDDSGHLWFGTDNGLSTHEGKHIRPWSPADGGPEGTIWASDKDRDGRLWFATQYSGVVRYDGKFRAFGADDVLPSNYAYGVLADRSGRLWIGHRGSGLTRCRITSAGDLAECRTLGTDDGIPNLDVHALTEDRDGNIWFGTRGGGVGRIDESGRIRIFTTEDGLSQNDVYALLVNESNELVLGTLSEGIDICSLPDLSECRNLNTRQGLADNSVITLALDRANDLWVGLENGLSRIGSEQLISFTPRHGLPHHTVYALAPDKDGSVWVGTLGGIARITGGGDEFDVGPMTGATPLPGDEVWDMEIDQSGRLWVATNRGLCEFRQEKGCVTILDESRGLSSNDLITLGQTRSGKLLVSSLDGLSIVDPSSPAEGIRNITLQEGLAGSVPYGIAEDQYGRIWLGTDRGLSVVDGEQIRSYQHADGLPVDDISALLSDEAGRIWIGSNGGGLVSFDPPPSLDEASPSFETYGLDRGVPEAVAALELAPDGEIWLGTNDGVFRFNIDRRAARLSFDKDSGLIGNEVNVMKTDREGRLWTGVVGGVTVWKPNVDEPDAPPPIVRIEELRSFSGHRWRRPFTAVLRDVEASKISWLGDTGPELSHEQNSLRLEFRALTFRERGRLRFQTRLEGFEDTWSEPTTEAFKEYTNLDPGTYRFSVRAAVRNGRWGMPETLGFTVHPAWWQTTWFTILSIVGMILVLGGGYRARTYAINARNRELEAAVDERTEDLRRYARALEEHSHALDRANERIRQSDRVKSEFLTNMSHELRTPLNAIIGFSEVLDTRLEERLDDRESLFLHNIQSSGKYLLMMINNLLDLSKIEAGRMQLDVEAVYVPAIIQEICNVVRGYATQKGIEIETTIDPSIQSVETDIGKLEQVLINLLSNAVKFSPSGEMVRVKVGPAGDDHWKLSVTDRGPGIDDKDLDVIFEEFSQARGNSAHPGGTGLGLALVKRFVTILGGEVEVTSEAGIGSTFIVILPRKPQETAEQPKGWETRPGSAGILLAGTSTQLSPFTELLEREGFTPVHAHDHHEMIRYGREIHPAASVIAIDATVPETWRRVISLKEELHDLEMGLLVCLFNGDRLIAAFGADDWVVLPVRPDDLAATVALQGPLSRRQTVITISDRDHVLDIVENSLDERDFDVVRMSSGVAAIEAVEDESNTCFIVDLCIEKQAGFEIAHRIQHDRRTRHLPVVILAEADPGDDWFEGVAEYAKYDSSATWEDLVLLIHEIVRRRSSRIVRRASGLFD